MREETTITIEKVDSLEKMRVGKRKEDWGGFSNSRSSFLFENMATLW